MLHRICASVALCFFVSLTSANAAEPSVSDFQGKWTVTDVVGYGNTSGGIPEARELLGKVLNISPTSIEFSGELCRPHQGFRVGVVDTASRLKDDFGINLEDTGLPETTEVLDSANCTAVYRMDERRVLFGWDGVVLRAVRP
ncbi:hypothetical protein P0D75_30575 [Paraburkholderia sediminicola]|uniref:hypothetical protein n=1 Tax=Paraburkholderia sediminicola TaxID=458836 RepID=UPI0038BD52D0